MRGLPIVQRRLERAAGSSDHPFWLPVGAGAAVALVGWLWGVEVCNDRVAVTGTATLGGDMDDVGALREKALAVCRFLTATLSKAADGTSVSYQGCLIVPQDNTHDGFLVEHRSGFDATASFTVRRHGLTPASHMHAWMGTMWLASVVGPMVK